MTRIDPSSAPDSVKRWMVWCRDSIDTYLAERMSMVGGDLHAPGTTLVEAMRYAVLGGGKRLRPALCFAAAEACGAPWQVATPAAAAVELLHAYTLVHDDLPAMDDDDERRGRPTVHRQFDEATAILAGDALLTMAFEEVANLETGAAHAVRLLAQRGGARELLGGQMLDLAMEAGAVEINEEHIEVLHRGKTGALFAASCQLGAISAGASTLQIEAMGHYGLELGVAFQYADDLDDGDFPDRAQHAHRQRQEMARSALGRLSPIPSPERLADLVRWVGGIDA